MSTPWEKYQNNSEAPPAEGPWAKYAEKGPDATVSAMRKFLQGATASFSDEIAGGVEVAGQAIGLRGLGGPLKDISLDSPTLDPDELGEAYERARDLERKNLALDQETSPYVSTAFEMAGGIASPLNKLTKGLSVAKQGLIQGGLYGAGASEADNLAGVALDTAKGGVIGGVTGKTFDALGNLIAPEVSKASSKAATAISPAISKANKDKIISAAKRLDLELTPAMLDDTGFVERLEFTLAESPSFLGQRIKGAQKKAYESLQNAVSEATKEKTVLSEFQVGERVKSGLTSKVAEKLDPISAVFTEVRESTKHIPVSDKSKAAIIRNIKNADEFVLTGGVGKAGQYVDMLGRVKNADQLKSMMTMLNSDIQAAQGAEKQVLASIKNKLSNLEDNSITRAAIQQAKEAGMRGETGKKIASEIVGELKEARGGYRQLMSDLADTAQDARLGKNYGVSNFLDKVENLPSETIQRRFFNTDNQRQLQNLAKNFPEEFDLLRQGKLRDIVEAAEGGRGEVSVQRFLNEVQKLSPEAKEVVFRGGGQILEDVSILNRALPRNFNPSGSGTQSGWQEAAYRNVKDIPTYLLYKGASTNLGQKIGRTLQDGVADKTQEITSSAVKGLSNPFVRLMADRAASDAAQKNSSEALEYNLNKSMPPVETSVDKAKRLNAERAQKGM